jgi:hypothetical protein
LGSPPRKDIKSNLKDQTKDKLPNQRSECG